MQGQLLMTLLQLLSEGEFPQPSQTVGTPSRLLVNNLRKHSLDELLPSRFNDIYGIVPYRHLWLYFSVSVELLLLRKYPDYRPDNHLLFNQLGLFTHRDCELVPTLSTTGAISRITTVSMSTDLVRNYLYGTESYHTVQDYILPEITLPVILIKDYLWTPSNQAKVLNRKYPISWYYPPTTDATLCYSAPWLHDLFHLSAVTNTPIPDSLLDRWGNPLNNYSPLVEGGADDSRSSSTIGHPYQ